jgi:hypothetical protein
LELSQADEASRPEDAKLQALRADALKLLQSGFDDARKSGAVTEASATSALYLAQSLLADGKFAEASAMLADPKMGPLTLVESGNEATQRPEFAMEVYKAAFRPCRQMQRRRLRRLCDWKKRRPRRATTSRISWREFNWG